MSSKRKTGPAHVARKRKRRKPVDLYAIARRARMPVAPGDLDGMTVREVRLAAQAHRRMDLRRSLSELISSLVKDVSLTNAFSDALMPQLLYRPMHSIVMEVELSPSVPEASTTHGPIKTAGSRVPFTLVDPDREDD